MKILPLIKGELYKIFKSKTFFFPIGLVLLVIITSAIISINSKDGDWRSSLEKKIEDDYILISELKMTESEDIINMIQEDIKVNEYHLEHDIPPHGTSNIISYIEKYSGITSLIGIIVMVYASNIISKETSWGTLKMMLLRPFTKKDVLISKYISLLVYGLLLYILLIFLLIVSGLILYGFEPVNWTAIEYFENQFRERNMLIDIGKRYLFSFILLAAFTSLALMVSVIFNSSAISIVVTFGSFIFGGSVSAFFSSYEWSKLLFFTNADLVSFGIGNSLNSQATPVYSTIIILAYTILFILSSLYIFNRKALA